VTAITAKSTDVTNVFFSDVEMAQKDIVFALETAKLTGNKIVNA
jgi:hypothetical protein